MVPPTAVHATPVSAFSPVSEGSEPRVIQQFTSVFLVSRFGELWRVYDTASPDGHERKMPSAKSTLPYRLFLALARKTEVRVHAFAPGESHDIDPSVLQGQLDDSRPA